MHVRVKPIPSGVWFYRLSRKNPIRKSTDYVNRIIKHKGTWWNSYTIWEVPPYCTKWIILDMGAANERRRYKVSSSLIGWAHTNHDLSNRNVLAWVWSNWALSVHTWHNQCVTELSCGIIEPGLPVCIFNYLLQTVGLTPSKHNKSRYRQEYTVSVNHQKQQSRQIYIFCCLLC